MKCLPEPCASCPYRQDVPSGVWHPSEYAKLPQYDDNEAFGIFLCHNTQDTVCRGWLNVHAESVAVRLAVATGKISRDAPYMPTVAKLFSSGREAAAHGLRNIKAPDAKAKRTIAKVSKTLQRRLGKIEGSDE